MIRADCLSIDCGGSAKLLAFITALIGAADRSACLSSGSTQGTVVGLRLAGTVSDCTCWVCAVAGLLVDLPVVMHSLAWLHTAQTYGICSSQYKRGQRRSSLRLLAITIKDMLFQAQAKHNNNTYVNGLWIRWTRTARVFCILKALPVYVFSPGSVAAGKTAAVLFSQTKSVSWLCVPACLAFKRRCDSNLSQCRSSCNCLITLSEYTAILCAK